MFFGGKAASNCSIRKSFQSSVASELGLENGACTGSGYSLKKEEQDPELRSLGWVTMGTWRTVRVAEVLGRPRAGSWLSGRVPSTDSETPWGADSQTLVNHWAWLPRVLGFRLSTLLIGGGAMAPVPGNAQVAGQEGGPSSLRSSFPN